ncbi:hypothetical protein DB32_002250 [Sandaracinus amylolyticus]|uniref:BNR repeat domain protein n=1 Tax=Sandaracinus amylolyticus TaxID=927083 RepID=A0A0F6YGU7_9BACT|nr:hypothetical protein DB32_002250 [Sandaracinus amylolyticus]
MLSLLVLAACGGDPPAIDGGLDAAASCATDQDCDDGLFCNGAVSLCLGGRCAPAPLPCREGQTCVEEADRCLTTCAVDEDADGDGARAIECGGSDCDDADPDRFPGNAELCDASAHDEDCDDTTFGFRDADGDGSPDARCCNPDLAGGEDHCGLDCDDNAPGVHPSVPEVCNGIDDDCDALVDEELVRRYTIDGDGDGHGDASEDAPTMDACEQPIGWALLADDCDDANADRFVGNPEICDAAMVDEDCSGASNDVPGGCECTGAATEVCGTMGRCTGATRQCVDGTWGPCAVVPQTEVCIGDAVDEDCDGSIDEGLSVTCYRDNDGDGYAADSAAPTPTCRSTSTGRQGAPWNGCPTGFTGRAPGAGATDCCDSDDRAHPGAAAQSTARACGGFDFDCDGSSTPASTSLATCGSRTTSDACRQASADGAGNGWCSNVPSTCGAMGSWGNGCWWTGAACWSVTCSSQRLACR